MRKRKPRTYLLSRLTAIHVLIYLFAFASPSFAKKNIYNVSESPVPADSTHLNLNKVYAYLLDGNAVRALALLDSTKGKVLFRKDSLVLNQIEKRFGYNVDYTDYFSKRHSNLDSLLSIYTAYWRASLLQPNASYDALLKNNIVKYLKSKYNKASGIDTSITSDRLSSLLISFIRKRGYRTTGFGKTGRLFDLLVWTGQEDTIYRFRVNGETTKSRVLMLNDFVSLGWEEYATLGVNYPGGWATKKALYCVKKAYDLNSENFLISYLAHESRHFSDYKLFPHLSSVDLEYRAKLTELALARTTLYQTIGFFIENGNANSANAHSIADYLVIRDMSEFIFKKKYDGNLKEWQNINMEAINRAAQEILRNNTIQLQLAGKEIRTYVQNT